MQKFNFNKKNIITSILIVIGCGIILFASYNLYKIYDEYKTIDDEYEEILENVTSSTEIIVEGETETSTEETIFTVDFNKLKEINEDVIGWIRFDQPDKISYPIAQGVNNDEYIRTNLYGKYSTAGTIFIDSVHSSDFSDRNTFIYGHNMRNGSMFGTLKQYRDKNFYKQNPYFYIYTPDGKMHTYQIFAVCVVNTASESYTYVFNNNAEFMKYIENAKSISLYKTNVEVPEDSKIVSLSTCTSGPDDERLLVHAVLIKSE